MLQQRAQNQQYANMQAQQNSQGAKDQMTA